MSKITFFYCTGTAYSLSILNNALKIGLGGQIFWGDPSVNPDKLAQVTSYVAGLDGKTYPWDGSVFNDPFPFMLDTSIWEPVRIPYADAAITFLSNGQLVGGMGASIDDGVSKVMAKIIALPPGAPFAIGGYSQGAAVMSSIYNEIRSGSLASRASSFLGGVMFGNPRRQVDFRGEVGGTWSGAWDVPGSNTGGHGSFPATGPWARLSGCEGTKWIEFAAPNDIITATGDSQTGTYWTQGNDALLSLLYSQFAGPIVLEAILSSLPVVGPAFASPVLAALQTAGSVGGAMNYLIDAAGTMGAISGAGHVIYPVLPPPDANGNIPKIEVPATIDYTTSGAPTSNVVGTSPRTGRLYGGAVAGTTQTAITHTYLKPDGDTCYQIALKWLNSKAASYATAPLVLPSTGSVGWSTTLIPPAVSTAKYL